MIFSEAQAQFSRFLVGVQGEDHASGKRRTIVPCLCRAAPSTAKHSSRLEQPTHDLAAIDDDHGDDHLATIEPPDVQH